MRLSEAWRFKQDDSIRGAEAPSFADSDWAIVGVPHTWNRVGHYLAESSQRVNTPENINKVQGVGWYRLSFTPPASFSGQRAWLQFGAASRMANVWLNGIHLGEHQGGFSRFRFDATAALKPGEVNVLAVKTDNTQPAVGASTADILPYRGDFFVHGGLYRPVSLIATDPMHIDMLDFGGPGVYATTSSIEGQRAQVSVRTKLRNDGQRRARVTVNARLVDADGHVAAEEIQRITLAAQADAEVAQKLMLTNARLWRGVEDPHLYRLQVEVRAPHDRIVDHVEHAFGVRQMHMDPDRGFLLNGQRLRLHGVGLHQDREGKGWAQSEEDIAADFELLREMGVNTLRLTHYQHGQTIHDLADRYGMILWDEIPLVSAWTLTGEQKKPTPGLVANAGQQLQELIRQNFNHTSVAVWGLANEVDFGKHLPMFLAGNKSLETPDPLPLLHELNRLAKTEDPTRPTALATCCEGRYEDVPISASVADVGGANRYFGWYYDEPHDLDAHLESLRARRPRQSLSITEYGAGGAISMHTDHPLGGPVNPRGREQPEEYMSYVHESAWSVLQTKPYLWATWLWNAFDFSTTVRREGDADDINTKGLVTYDRKVKKDAFYFYKANWTTTPTVHINSRRYVDRAYAVTDVRVYSNASATELLINGKSLGATRDCPDKICIWRNVQLAVGANEVIAKGRFGIAETEDRVAWHVAPEIIEHVRIDSGAILGSKLSHGHFGSDCFFEGGTAKSRGTRSDLDRSSGGTQTASAELSRLATTYREGDFRYRIPLGKGRYSVKLTFFEPSRASGERRFDVIANGARKLANLDVAAAAGAPLTALTRTFHVHVNDGLLDLQFKSIAGEAIVSAVEVSRGFD